MQNRRNCREKPEGGSRDRSALLRLGEAPGPASFCLRRPARHGIMKEKAAQGGERV